MVLFALGDKLSFVNKIIVSCHNIPQLGHASTFTQTHVDILTSNVKETCFEAANPIQKLHQTKNYLEINLFLNAVKEEIENRKSSFDHKKINKKFSLEKCKRISVPSNILLFLSPHMPYHTIGSCVPQL